MVQLYMYIKTNKAMAYLCFNFGIKTNEMCYFFICLYFVSLFLFVINHQLIIKHSHSQHMDVLCNICIAYFSSVNDTSLACWSMGDFI